MRIERRHFLYYATRIYLDGGDIAPERGWTHAHLDSCAMRPEDFGFLWGARGQAGGGSGARAARLDNQ